jgi:ABC-type phosphate/phosphonate transport system substrate-binding protein
VVAARRLPGTVKRAIQEALLALDGDAGAEAALAHGFVERLVAVDDSAYDDIRAMLAAIHRAGYTVLR